MDDDLGLDYINIVKYFDIYTTPSTLSNDPSAARTPPP